MKLIKKYSGVFLSSLCMVAMICMGRKGADSAAEGVALCLQVVIPSLFPFFVISTYLNSQLTGLNFRWLRPIGKLCGMPAGSEPILILGLLGGYPVGAQSVSLWLENGSLKKEDAQRMLGFCNNAGPAFIFGMLSAYFPSQKHLWLLWLVQIMSAGLTGLLLPGRTNRTCDHKIKTTVTLPQALERSLKSICLVCGWVILFKMLLSTLLSRIHRIHPTIQVILKGLLELTNGCTSLNSIPSLAVRFVVTSVLLSFGGICVLTQTASVAQKIGLKYYAAGKLIQTALSFLISCMLQNLLKHSLFL